MKFTHTRRGVLSFFLLGLITLSVYDVVVLSAVGREINEIRGDEDRKSMPFWAVWLLGWPTLGIVPLIWACRVAGKIEDEEVAIGIEKPRTSFWSLFSWTVFGSFILVGPWIGWHRFFAALNRVETAINEGKDLPDVKISMSSFDYEKPATPEPAPSQPIVSSPQAPKGEPLSAGKMKPYAYVAPEKPVPSAQIHLVPSSDPSPKEYRVASPKTIKKWQVRFADAAEAVKLFDTEEEAIAFAKTLAAKQGVSVRVSPRSEKIKKE